jgi:NDP-sugar pyrophosphorylase family protein
MRILILAAGDGTRWKRYLGVPKHLIPVDNERIVDRTVRLLQQLGITDIYLVGLDSDEFKIEGTELYIAKKNPKYHGADKFLSSQELWNQSGRTITLFGDIFFTEESIDKIVNDQDKNWKVYGRFGGSKFTRKGHGELFGQSFYPEHIKNHREKLFYIIELVNKKIINRCIGWEHYRAMQGAENEAVSHHKMYQGFDSIDDWTDDFDGPEDYDRFIKNWENRENF